jgi:hypothetical protein
LLNLAVATITNSAFDGNVARGGSASTSVIGDIDVGSGIGGAVTNTPFFDGSGGGLSVSSCTFTNNQAIGGAGNIGGPLTADGIGGALADWVAGATAVVMGCMFSANQALGAAGSSGGSGADGLGGGIANFEGSSLTASGCTLNGNLATGGAGGSGANGGNGFGGALYNDGTSSLAVTGSTLTGNEAIGGAAGSGGIAGLGEGGGLYLTDGGEACLDTFTQAHTTNNQATADHDDIFGSFMTC